MISATGRVPTASSAWRESASGRRPEVHHRYALWVFIRNSADAGNSWIRDGQPVMPSQDRRSGCQMRRKCIKKNPSTSSSTGHRAGREIIMSIWAIQRAGPLGGSAFRVLLAVPTRISVYQRPPVSLVCRAYGVRCEVESDLGPATSRVIILHGSERIPIHVGREVTREEYDVAG
ncbi:hypothetical protein BDV59DRAFT_179425 [Aspergillus ambiguus]|uniref:uncharacterized protein n=1 Tax=Aspergillus ambiguus TaxID=176160 RepID=UPI003CCDB06C